jgi:hypothetical protein
VPERVVLISRSCTTGWTDWIHGELWLSPQRLMRRRIGFWRTIGNGLWRTVPSPLPVYDITEEQVLAVEREHRTNLAVSWSDVADADLRKGLLTDRLLLRMNDGVRHRLLCFSWDGAFGELAPVVQAIKATHAA